MATPDENPPPLSPRSARWFNLPVNTPSEVKQEKRPGRYFLKRKTNR